MNRPSPVVIAYGLGALAIVGGLVWLYRSQQNSQFAGFGLLGFLGNAADKASVGTLSETGSAIGIGLYDWFHPAPAGPSVTYRVTFPNGNVGAVNSESVDSDGFFAYEGTTAGYPKGTRFRLAVNGGSYYAKEA